MNQALTQNSDDKMQAVSRKSESRARWFWIGVILSFFGLQALLWTTALSLVKKHPHRPLQTESTKSVDAEHKTSVTDSIAKPKVSALGGSAGGITSA